MPDSSPLFRLTFLFGLLWGAPSASCAATIGLAASDAVDLSSFASGLNWTGGAAPSAGNDYVVGTGLRLRTPLGNGSYTFAGDSLTVRNGFDIANPNSDANLFGLTYKGAGTTGRLTVANLILDGGSINHLSGVNEWCQIAGRVTVLAPSLIRAKQGPISFRAAVTGSANLYIGVTDGGGPRIVTFLSDNSQGLINTFTGDLVLTATSSLFTVETGSNFTFAIGPSGVNNRIRGNGVLAVRGAFHLDLSASSRTYGDTWLLVAADTLNDSYGATFSIPGFTDADNDGVWLSDDGDYQFSETTGTLTFIGFTDTDSDGLPDEWETARFGDLDETAGGDFDSDSLTNLQEFLAGTDPTVPTDPDDTDADGLPDAWEQAHFGGLGQTAAADPDGDGSSNAAEFTAGSVPRNRASTPADTDADGLPDLWEQTQFATLANNAGDDPDGDRFSNLQEHAASTSPIDPLSRPAGTCVKIVPVDDGDAATSEFGYAGSSAINSVAFVRCSLQTFGNQQFMTWYGRHQYDSAATFNNTLWIGRRTLGSSHWEVFRHPTFTANTITDGHDVISFGIDGEGYMHLSWGMHGDAFHYSRSTAPVTGTAPIALGPDTTMTGTESQVTYPQFLRLPDGDLLFLFREVASGNGDTYVNRYDLATHAWTNVHGSASTQSPFIKGTGWSPNYNAYLNMPQLGGPDGDDLILTWCWRFSSGTSDSGSGASGYQTNNRINFARSPDAGLTWQRFDGTSYSLPITRNGEAGAGTAAEVIYDIPENYSLINQASTCLDSAGNPVTATWWAPNADTGNHRRQYRVVFRHDDGTWRARSVSSRETDKTTTRYAENHVRDLGRPTVVRDDADRIIVAYRDNQASNLANSDASLGTGVSNGITIVHSLPRAQDPDRLLWISFDLTSENLGNYETMIDNELWDQQRQLHFLYQPSEGQGFTAPANLAARISVLEWDAADYFNHFPQPGIEGTSDGTGVRIHWRSEPSFTYRLFTSTDLIEWTEVETRTGTGALFEHVHTLVPGEPKRFWRLDRAEGGF